MNNTIYQYVKTKKGNRKGLLLATKLNDSYFAIGYSLCNLKKDKFDKTLAFNIAEGRANAVPHKKRSIYGDPGGYPVRSGSIPSSIKEDWILFKIRASKYFKGMTLVS